MEESATPAGIHARLERQLYYETDNVEIFSAPSSELLV